MKTEIVKILRNATDSVSGQDLCQELGVSRTAIWKVMNQLKEEGYGIEAVQNKGYKMVSCPDLLSECEVGSRLTTRWLGKELVCLSKVDSTNVEVKRRGENGGKHGLVVLAEQQTAGRGRRGRGWDTKPGTSIALSLLLRPAFSPDKASMLTLLMALAACRSVSEVCGLESQIKWPNDVVLHQKKICGILTEMSAELDYIHYVVTGIGINVNVSEMPESLKDTATSLFIEGRKKYSRAKIAARLLYHYEQLYEEYEKTETLAGMLREYNNRLINKDREVRILDPKGEFEGTAKGINEAGELLVEKKNGETVNVYAGEVSVRGLYGYV